MRISVFAVLILFSALAEPGETFESICSDFDNRIEPEMQIQPSEFNEKNARRIIKLMEHEPETGLKEGPIGKPITSWAIFMKGYLLRTEWILADAENMSEQEVESRRKEFCQFLAEDGYYRD